MNPSNCGGRHVLSSALRSRFVILNVDEMPHNQYVDILTYKSDIPESWAKLMVKFFTEWKNITDFDVFS
jgi:midasin (ATPase involved in ribosome maturation)